MARGVTRRDIILGGGSAAALVVLGGWTPAFAGLGRADDPLAFQTGLATTARHATAYIECGPHTGPLMILLHGFPETAIVWRRVMAHFAAQGWRCVAPDMRGYGRSSVPTRVADFTVRAISTDMVELHDALGGAPAVWVGHDWGAPIAWTMASHHAERCRGVVVLSVPYDPRGHALPNLVPLVDRKLYPKNRYPVGQWDYWLYYRESLPLAARELDADPAATIIAFYRAGKPEDAGETAPTARLRALGGWFPPDHRAPTLPRDPRVLGQADADALADAFRRTGFRPGLCWYLNDADNLALAAEAPKSGRLDRPALFITAAYDSVDAVSGGSRLAEPMRLGCADLTEASVPSGHFMMLERAREVSEIMSRWLQAKGLA